MRRNVTRLFFVIIVMLFINGCGSSIQESAEMVTSNMFTSKREAMVKSEKIMSLENEQNAETAQLAEKKERTTKQKKQEKPQEQMPTYKAEKQTGDFMATSSLHMRKGPSTEFQSVGSLTPYEKAVATEKATLNGDTWYKVTSNGVTGWSSAKGLIAYQKDEKSSHPPKKKSKEQPAKENDKQPKTEPAEKASEKANQKTTEKPTQDQNTGATPTATEKAVIDLTNAERKKVGLSPLKIDQKTVASARAKSKDMAEKGYFSHTSPTYGSIDQQLKKFGVSFRSWGENIAQGQSSAEQVVKAWMNSKSHKDNILNANMTHIGVGHESSGNYWTQQFIAK